MKRLGKSGIILVMMVLLFLIPNVTYAYNKSYGNGFDCTDTDEICMRTGGEWTGFRKSFIGIFHQMRKNGTAWVASKKPTASADVKGWLTETGGPKLISKFPNIFSTAERNRENKGVIFLRGALCFGHAGITNGKAGVTISMTLDINENNKNTIEQYLAYSIYQSTALGETGGVKTANNKGKIAQWLKDHYKTYGGAIAQNTPVEAYGDNYITNESKAYAAKIVNETLANGTEREQTIFYQNGNTFIGPYNLKTKSGNLSTATITTYEGDKYSTSYCSTDGSTIKALSSITDYTGNFYIVVKDKELSSVKSISLSKIVKDVIVARIITGESPRVGGQNVAIFYGYKTDRTRTIELPGVSYSKISITKTDEDTGKALTNVGFIVYCQEQGGYVISGTPVTYTTDKSKATTFITDTTGKVTINNLNRTGTYSIYEVVNPHFGYEEVSVNQPKLVATANVTALGSNVSVTAKNKRNYIRISGYAWEDKISEKMSVRNWLWKNDSNDTEDRGVNNIKVTLKKADETIIDTTTTITDSNNQEGAYVLGDYISNENAKKIEITDLEGAYIEFEYNGMCYKSVQVNTDADNGNKATDDKARNTFNDNYATIVNGEAQNGNGQKTYDLKYDFDNHVSTLNYGGSYLYGYYDEKLGGRQKYPISGIDEQYMITASTKDASPDKLLGQNITINDILSKGIEEIPNVNLGLWEREMPDMVAVEDIENVKIMLNGYEHTYEYAKRIADFEKRTKDKDFNVTVSYGSKYGPSSYTREFYSSDVVYNKKNPESLGVYITYRVALRNEATNLYTKVNEIINYYDERYDIYSVTDQEGNAISKENIIKDESFNENGYKRVKINVNQDINHQEQKYIYIRYKLNNDAINSLLNQEATLDSVTEITSYSSFDDEKFTNRYAGIDKDSEPETTKVGNIDTYEDDTDKAPSLILKVKEGRIIKGTVWEDAAIQSELDKTGYDRQRIGDGLYNSGENVIAGVEVKLLAVGVDASGATTYETAKLYKYDTSSGTTNIVDATSTTEVDGTYDCSGIIPGNYVLSYTYGNSSIIYDLNGNKLGDVNAEKYKSTIYNNGSEPSNMYWYAESERYSDAKDEIGIKHDGTEVDIVEERTKDNVLIKYETANEEKGDKKLENIVANTSIFDIKLEYDVDSDNISKDDAELKVEFSNIDFGIIRRPIQDIAVKKEVAFVELTLANGQTVISGDPRNEDIQYLKFMPDGSVHIELDDELIQGATLKIKYEIIVDNKKAEIDYNNKEYYYYGIVPTEHAGWAIATVERALDYLSNGLNFNAEDPNNKEWKDIKAIGEIKNDLVTNGFMSQEVYDVVKTYNQVLSTEAFKEMKPGEEKAVPLVATRLLSNNEQDFSFDNDLEVNLLYGRKMEYKPTDSSQVVPDEKDEYVYATPGNYVPGEGPKVESDDDMKEVVITGPTGDNNNYTPYILLGISSFIILGTGIIFIKKKVLD